MDLGGPNEFSSSEWLPQFDNFLCSCGLKKAKKQVGPCMRMLRFYWKYASKNHDFPASLTKQRFILTVRSSNSLFRSHWFACVWGLTKFLGCFEPSKKKAAEAGSRVTSFWGILKTEDVKLGNFPEPWIVGAIRVEKERRCGLVDHLFHGQ